MDKHIRIKVTGKVQGVGFRFTVHLAFVDLGITGTVENMKDGSIEITALGPEDKLERLVRWCHKGPEGAKVTGVEVTDVIETTETNKSGQE